MISSAFTPFELSAAREWIADCCGTLEQAQFWLDDATPREVMRCIARSYEGGIGGFRAILHLETSR